MDANESVRQTSSIDANLDHQVCTGVSRPAVMVDEIGAWPIKNDYDWMN